MKIYLIAISCVTTMLSLVSYRFFRFIQERGERAKKKISIFSRKTEKMEILLIKRR